MPKKTHSPTAPRIATGSKTRPIRAPLFGVIFGTGFLIAMIVGHFIAKWVKVLPDVVFALAGFAAIAVTLLALNAAFNITAIGAAREWDGFLSLCLCGALSGYAFSLARQRLTK